jgi:hypothetical protein
LVFSKNFIISFVVFAEEISSFIPILKLNFMLNFHWPKNFITISIEMDQQKTTKLITSKKHYEEIITSKEPFIIGIFQ